MTENRLLDLLLRFDVETIYKATVSMVLRLLSRLRFDVETIYKATREHHLILTISLRFDVETIYKATEMWKAIIGGCCGLM